MDIKQEPTHEKLPTTSGNISFFPPAPNSGKSPKTSEVRTVATSEAVDLYTHSITKLQGSRGRSAHIGTRDELIEGIKAYFGSLIGSDGRYLRGPTLLGLGLHLGFSSRSWHERYARKDEFADIIEHVRNFILEWKMSKVMVPTGGVNPAGIMFLMNRDDAREAAKGTTDDGGDQKDTRPRDVAALIDEVWKKAVPDKIHANS